MFYSEISLELYLITLRYMLVLQFRLFLYHTLKTLKCITSILQLSLHSLLMKTCACLVLSLLTYLFKCGWASKSNFVYFLLTSSHLIFQLWVAYAPCSAQHKDAVQVTLEQIDLIKRLVETYPNQLELVKTSQGKKLQENFHFQYFVEKLLDIFLCAFSYACSLVG